MFERLLPVIISPASPSSPHIALLWADLTDVNGNEVINAVTDYPFLYFTIP
jgi:hypothetical protein